MKPLFFLGQFFEIINERLLSEKCYRIKKKTERPNVIDPVRIVQVRTAIKNKNDKPHLLSCFGRKFEGMFFKAATLPR